MNLKDRMTNIGANLDDLQSGVEACSRATDTLSTDTEKFDGPLKEPLRRAVVRHVQHLRACADDQRAALQELRDSIIGLQQELKRSKGVSPLPVNASDTRRQ